MAGPAAVVQGLLKRVEHIAANRPARRHLLKMLRQADRELERRLEKTLARAGDAQAAFTVVQAQQYRAQIQTVTKYVQGRIKGLTALQSREAIKVSLRDTTVTLKAFEKQYKGVVSPLRLEHAANKSAVLKRTQASMLRQSTSSVDRYGKNMIGRFEKHIQQGLLQGKTQREMVDALVKGGGPGRLFVKHRYFAERIVRTEVAAGYSETALQAIYEQRKQFPDLGKKILAVMDNRTAPDSIAVHGQIRRLEEPFMDGAGRVYQRPPARPNDRETVIPWRVPWQENAHTLPKPPTQVAAAKLAYQNTSAMTRGQRVQARESAKATAAQQQKDQRQQQRTAAALEPKPLEPGVPLRDLIESQAKQIRKKKRGK